MYVKYIIIVKLVLSGVKKEIIKVWRTKYYKTK